MERPTREDVRKQLEHRGSWSGRNALKTDGKDTVSLLRIIPEETIRTILRAYRTIVAYEEHHAPVRVRHLPLRQLLPEKDFKAIREILLRHETIRRSVGDKTEVKVGWLLAGQVDEIMSYIRNQFLLGKKGHDLLSAEGREEAVKLYGFTRDVEPRHFVVFFLARHAKASGQKIPWQSIAGFLYEQGLLNEPDAELWAPIRLREWYKKTKEMQIWKHYERYRHIAVYPERKRRRDPFDTSREFVKHYTDIMIPPWHEMMPSH